MQNETSAGMSGDGRSSARIRTALHLTGFVLLPVLNFFVLSYIYNYIAGDMYKATLETALYWIRQPLTFSVPYVCAGMMADSVLRFGWRGGRGAVILGYLSFMIPYLGNLTVHSMLSGLYRMNLLYYALNAAVNYLVNAALITAALVIGTAVLKRAKKPETPYRAICITVVGGLLAIGLAQEIVYTVRFIYELLYEYYDSITINELISIITSYLLLFLKAVAGFAVMKLTSILLRRY